MKEAEHLHLAMKRELRMRGCMSESDLERDILSVCMCVSLCVCVREREI